MARALDLDPDATLRRQGTTLRSAVARILRAFDAATPADVEAGARWYGEESSTLLDTLVRLGAPSREHAAAVVAHLSPRTTWSRNVLGATVMCSGGDARVVAGCLGANVERAVKALGSDRPLSSFGPTSPKTSRFARNLLGDRDAVTVDVWAARVALGTRVGDVETILARRGVYAACEAAYRIAARRRGVDPTTMQATAWIVARGGRAA